MKNVVDALEERGFIEALSSDEFRKVTEQPIRVYCGFDPTSDSLHLGNLIAIMGLAWFQKFGHTPVAIVGGATGLVGDPSGKKHERPLLDEQAIEKNLQGIQKNLEAVLSLNPDNSPIILNNYDWFKKMSLIEFLRDVGKHFRLGPMLAKDSVKSRLESEEGMSFTEFTYQLLQAYDFFHLLEEHQVVAQIGGSDQWGNITAGSDLIRRLRGKPVYGVTFPLLTTSSGQKFGKSEKGAIWLSPEKCSPYEFYQYLFRTTDDDVIKLMRLLTFMEMDEICFYESEMKEEKYAPNTAQKKLAEEVTRIVHGEKGLQIALSATLAAAPGTHTDLNAQTLESISSEIPNSTLKKEDVIEQKLIDVMVKTGLQESKGQARRLIRNGGVYMNNQQIKDENQQIASEDAIEGKLILLAAGKKNKMLLHLE